MSVEVDARALHRRRLWGKVGRYALLTVLAVIVLFPIYITIVNSLLRRGRHHPAAAQALPDRPAVGQLLSDAWNAGHMGTYLKNSFIVTFIITVGQVLTAILAGYAFAFLEFPFKRTLFVVFLATLMVPFEVTIVTNVTTISDLGLVQHLRRAWRCRSSPPASARSSCARRSSPCRTTSATPPPSTATGTGGSCWRVAVPLARPAVAALTVFAFLAAWNQYLWPLLITKDDKLRTVQIGLKQLQQVSIDQVNITFAGAIIAVVPLVILLLFFQKQLVRGLTAGAVKG